MIKNKQTSELVKKELENDLYLLELLKEGLINYSALSKKLFKKIKSENPKATLESISISAKRYVDRISKLKISDSVKTIIASSQLSTRDNIVHLTYNKDKEVFDEITHISKKIDWNQEELFLMNQGSGEITLIIDKKNVNLVSNYNMIEKRENLSIISIKESLNNLSQEKSINICGVYAYFISQLSRRGINIVEIISTYSQLTLVFNNSDLLNAYKILKESIEHFKQHDLN